MSIIERAMDECEEALKRGISGERRPEGQELKSFRKRFLQDFTKALSGSDPEPVWNNDSAAITALAKAIGALAEHYAASDKGATRVRRQDLDRAFDTLKTECTVLARNPQIRAKYCEYAGGSAKQEG